MGGKTALLGGFLLGGGLALAAEQACAQGMPFGGGFKGFHFGGPRFDGPRFDGPGSRDLGPPLPHEPGSPEPASRESLGPPPPEPAGPDPGEKPPPPGAHSPRKCFGQAESRARVAQLKLRAPFEMMRRASHLAQAQALGGKLCRWADLDIYDISLLRADGRVVHVFLDATNGQLVVPPPPPPPH